MMSHDCNDERVATEQLISLADRHCRCNLRPPDGQHLQIRLRQLLHDLPEASETRDQFRLIYSTVLFGHNQGRNADLTTTSFDGAGPAEL